MSEQPRATSARPPVREQTSAGGVILRRVEGGVETALIRPRGHERWQLPKGIIDPGEAAEAAAVREAWEETGLECELVAPIDTIDYWYQATEDGQRIRFHKRVHFYLLTVRAGVIGRHDHEIDEARWVPIEEALAMLTFANERRIVEDARSLFDAGPTR